MSGSKKNNEKRKKNQAHSNADEPDFENNDVPTGEPAEQVETENQEHAEAGPAKEEANDTEKELAASKDRYLRLQADFDNFRKRALKESAELVKTATRDFIEKLLPVLDHFELGLKAADESEANKSVAEGFRLVYNQLLDELKNAGVTPFDSEGQPFDHNLHDCVSRIPSEEHPEDVIVTQIRRGYYINDKILRHAQVVVSSGSAQKEQKDAPPASDSVTDEQPDITDFEPE